MSAYTVGQMAELLELASPKFSAAYYARQIRGWAQADLFPDAGIRGSGRTAAQVFQSHHLVEARIYGVLTMMGMTVPQLRLVQACFRNSIGIVNTVKSYEKGDQDWRFVLHLTNEGEVYGGKFCKELRPNRLVDALAPNIIVLAAGSIFRALDFASHGDHASA